MTILLTVTNDLTYDQRMQRICGSLAEHGYQVMLIGRTLPHSIPLKTRQFQQKRLSCRFKKGFVFYAEYNIRLFFFLLFHRRWDAVCAIDLDTICAVYAASVLRRKKRVFDAHEYFTEVPEVVGRPFVKGFWQMVANFLVPRFRHAYTVGPALAGIFKELYHVDFKVVRNVPLPQTIESKKVISHPETILYQGALNEGRGIEQLLVALKDLEGVRLQLAGEGDLSEKLRKLAVTLGVEEKVEFLGLIEPEPLKKYTRDAWLCVNLLEHRGASYYYSLANKFFDAVQAGTPVLTMNFPEYKTLNEQFEVAVLLPDLDPVHISQAIRTLQGSPEQYNMLIINCLKASKRWNWKVEEQTLLELWKAL
ncbi:MAG: glycosyltransferase [Saprospiraceae bacterium]|nr:glycosyltransferase [Saprospiraceae bacterium]